MCTISDLFIFSLYFSILEVRVNKLLSFAFAIVVVTWIIELNNRKDVLAPLCRGMFTMLIGTWLISIGAILTPPFSWMPKYDGNSHATLMLMTSIFIWNFTFISIFIILVFFATYFKYKRQGLLDEGSVSHPNIDHMSVQKDGRLKFSMVDSDDENC